MAIGASVRIPQSRRSRMQTKLALGKQGKLIFEPYGPCIPTEPEVNNGGKWDRHLVPSVLGCPRRLFDPPEIDSLILE